MDKEAKKKIGYLYRVDCSCGLFYVGMSTRMTLKSVSDYMGSGIHWKRHIDSHLDHIQIKTILKYFSNREALIKAEVFLIKDHITNPLCANIKTWSQGSECSECKSLTVHRKHCSNYSISSSLCNECSSLKSNHKISCRLFEKRVCIECLGRSSNHRKSCSQYSPTFVVCFECDGSMAKHKKTCSNFTQRNKCDLCGNRTGHKKFCEYFCGDIPENYCFECDSIDRHKRKCSKWIIVSCSECNSVGALHFKRCSKFKERVACKECKGKANRHYKTCRLYTL